MKLTQREWREAGGPEMQIGLGWIRRKKGEAGIIWHNGGTGGYHSFMGFAPENSTGVVILSNSTNNIDDIGFHILDAETQLAEIDAAPKIAPVSPEICQDYVGEYELSPQLLFTITSKNNTLYAQLTGQQAFPVYPESETKFFYKVVDAEIEFKLTETGEVVGLTLFQAGQELFAQKL